MTISVAVCTFQGGRWLEPFLSSVLAQDRLPDELVVSDDGSTDDTLALLDAFADRAPFPVRVSTTPSRLGSTDNFARVFAQCRGDLIAAADQDDLWMPAKLRRLEAELARPGVDLVFSDGTVIDADGRPTGVALWEGVGFDRRLRSAFDRDALGVLIRRSVVTGAAMMFRSSVLATVLPFPAVLNAHESPMLQDRWMAIVLAAEGRVRAVPEPLIAFRQHDDQQTGLRTGTTTAEVARQLRRSRAASAASFLVRAEQLEAAAARVGDGTVAGRRLAAGARLLRRRAGLPDARLARVARVCRDAIAGRYRRYGGGWRSAVADVARPAR